MESQDINQQITFWRSMCENWSTKNDSKPEHYLDNIQTFLMRLVSEFDEVKIEEIPKRFPQAGPLLNKLFHLNAVRSNTITSSLLLRCIYYFTKKSSPGMEERGLNWAAQRIKSVHNATKHSNLEKMMSTLGFSNSIIVQSNIECQAKDILTKLDLFESQLPSYDPAKARKVLRELSEAAIPLISNDAYWQLIERIVSCYGTLLTYRVNNDHELSFDSMDIVEDEQQMVDAIALEHLGAKRHNQPKTARAFDLPIGSEDSRRIHVADVPEDFDDLHPQFLKIITTDRIFDKCANRTKSILWLKYPSYFYDQVYDIIEDATVKKMDVTARVERMTEVFCYRPALFHCVMSILRALFEDTRNRALIPVTKQFLTALVSVFSTKHSLNMNTSMDLFVRADQVGAVHEIAFGSPGSDEKVALLLAIK